MKNEVRIIGGQWKRTRLAVADKPGLRPTPDRVRETLFNWLQPWLDGARCADLFCGTGVLGLEALSRGAAHSVFVDRSAQAIAQVQASITRLEAAGAETLQDDAEAWIQRPGSACDIVFLDPPYRLGLAARCLDLLASSTRLSRGGLVYAESAIDEPPPVLPPGWDLHRDKQAGQVAYRLYRAAGG